LTAVLLLCLGALTAGVAAPVIFWASDPVQPGETVVVSGAGFGDKPSIMLDRPEDGPLGGGFPPHPPRPPGGAAFRVLQATDQSLKFVVPPQSKPGVYYLFVEGGGKVARWSLNRPAIWWWRGAGGEKAHPGRELRLFGRNLAMSGGQTTVELYGARRLQLPAKSDGYSASVDLPADLAPGEYKVSLHNGYGGKRGWSDVVSIQVARPVPWPTRTFNVKDFGADGTGARDDTAAIQEALHQADAAGGGIVYLPRGRYQITDTLTIPRFTVLRGEKRELVALFWPDFETPPEALIKGTNSFALEELTVYASQHRHVIAGDLGNTPDAGNVRLHRVRVRADSYRGHLTPEQVDERFRTSLKWSTGGGDTVRLGGENVVITHCDLYGSGRSLFLSRARHSLVRDNQLYNGRWGWYCFEGSDGLIFEHNQFQGGDLMSTGGGLANYSTAFSRNVYYSYNDMRFAHGWDREIMTTDAGGEAYFGKVAATRGNEMTLAEDPKWGSRNWFGGGVFILDGTGAGQWRYVQSYEGRKVVLDRPWDVPPDATSVLGITMFHGRYAFVGNTFTDTGAFQFYGTSIECYVVGNTATRTQGFSGLGLWYHGFQPSWYNQFLSNTIAEGNYYHWTSATDAQLQVYGASRPEFSGYLNRGTVLRDNRLLANAHISVSGTTVNALVENNFVANSATGVFVSQTCGDVLVRGNKFEHVEMTLVDEPALRQAAQEKLKQYLGRPDPVLAYDFEELTGGKLADLSGDRFSARAEGGVTVVDGGVRGKAAHFDGQGHLTVNEPAVFNAPDLTVTFWMRPETLKGRRGLVAKRFGNAAAPWIIGHTGASLTFEATDEAGKWSFNFVSPAVLKENQWTYVAVVMKTGDGVTIYADGKPIAKTDNPAGRMSNMEPLIIGREAWGGDPPTTAGPGCYLGLLDRMRIWTRALSPAEIQSEMSKGVTP